MLGSNRSICLNIFRSIATERQPRILHFFETGGPKGDYNWQSFLNHVKEQYEDKQARQTASNLLHRMRMGANQYFTDYLQDFELKLSQSGKTGLDDSTKISQLDTGINSSLRQLLLNKTLPEADYHKWVTKVRAIAGRLENTPSYRPTGCTGKNTFYIPQNGQRYYSTVESPRIYHEPIIDGDGDTKMSNVNKIQALLTAISALGSSSSHQGQQKPSAKWRSLDEFKKMSGEGKCIRCGKIGHKTRLCPTYGPARRKPAEISHVNSTSISDLERILAQVKYIDSSGNTDKLKNVIAEEETSGEE